MVGEFEERSTKGKKKKTVKHGNIVRQGDIIKFGRVPVMIKESSIDIKRWEKVKKVNEEMQLSDQVQMRANGFE